METYGPAKALVVDPEFASRKQEVLNKLNPRDLDPPMVGLVTGFNLLPHCYTLQCCHGHIIIPGPLPPGQWQRLPAEEPPAKALFQIAYLALAVRNDPWGRSLRAALARLAEGNPAFLQMGSADWFWYDQGQVNSYILQVCPRRCRERDRFEMQRPEARQWLAARKEFMRGLGYILRREMLRCGLADE